MPYYCVIYLIERFLKGCENMLIQEDSLSIRPLQNGDQLFLVKWLSNPEVIQYYEGRDRPFSLAEVEKNFFQQDDRETRCLIQYNETSIGYLQFYEIGEEEREVYGYYNRSERIYGMDQFIGEPYFGNKGIGTGLITLVSQYLLEEKDAYRVVVDPQTCNERAIRCYEKCGFEKVRILPKREPHEGVYRDCWLMECC